MNLKECKVLVTATSYGKNDPGLKTELESSVAAVIYNPVGKPLTSQEVSQLLPGIDGCIAGLDQFDENALKSADRLKVISRYGVGYDKIDINAANARGIIITNTPGVNSSSVAELAIGFMLALARQIPEAVEAVHQGKWPRFSGISLEGKTIGIIGLGSIGKQLAKRLAGFECNLLAFDPQADREFSEKNQVRITGMDELLEKSDFVSLHLPVLPNTREMVNAEFLMKMKKGSFLINTARGELIHEEALFEAITNGHVRGAGLDAFQTEPPEPSNPLLTLPQVVCTPHLGAQTDNATNMMGRTAMEDCLAVLRNEQPRFRVN
jgi:D-3-phosphoglycerate dehydrogenase